MRIRLSQRQNGDRAFLNIVLFISILPFSFSFLNRWVKYEETVEEGGKRWSKPHVASLSFHYVMEMRKCLLEGAFLVDAEAYSMSLVIGEYRQTLPITYNNMRLVFGRVFEGRVHTPSIAFRHLPPNAAGIGHATEGALFIPSQLSADGVSALRKVSVLIPLWKQHKVH